MMNKFPKVLVLALLIFSSMSVSNVLAQGKDEVECGGIIEETLDGDPIGYEFEVEDGVVLSIALQSEDFDTLIEIYEDGDLFASDDDGGDGLNSFIILTEPGVYEVVVTSFSGSAEGDFVLTVACAGECEVDTDELDDDETAMQFDFEAEEGDNVLLVAYSDDFDTFINLLDEDEDVLESDDDSAFGLNSLLVFEVEDDGDYLLEVTSFSGAEVGEFTVMICADAGDIAPTESTADYTFLECGDTITGTVDDDFPFVFFYYNGQDGDEITVTHSAQDGDLDPYLALFTIESSDNNETVAENDDTDGLNSEITYELEEDTIITIAASRYDFAEGTTSGEFEVELECN